MVIKEAMSITQAQWIREVMDLAMGRDFLFRLALFFGRRKAGPLSSAGADGSFFSAETFFLLPARKISPDLLRELAPQSRRGDGPSGNRASSESAGGAFPAGENP